TGHWFHACLHLVCRWLADPRPTTRCGCESHASATSPESLPRPCAVSHTSLSPGWRSPHDSRRVTHGPRPPSVSRLTVDDPRRVDTHKEDLHDPDRWTRSSRPALCRTQRP